MSNYINGWMFGMVAIPAWVAGWWQRRKASKGRES